MKEELLLRAAREAPWHVPLPAPAEVRARGTRRQHVRYAGIAVVLATAAVAAAAWVPGTSGGDEFVADRVTGPLRVGAVVLDELPDGWSLTDASGTDGAAAHACLGPESKPCAVHVIAAHQPTRDSGIDWFSVLTERCLSPKSTTVFSEATQLPAGPGHVQTLACAGAAGDIDNTAWVLDAGVAVIPDSAAEIDHARDVVIGLRFSDGEPWLPPAAPSEEPSAQSQPTGF